MEIRNITTRPFKNQRPGTSGLRKPVKKFQQEHYLQNFVQSIFDVIQQSETKDLSRETLVVGGDGRFYNREAIQIIISMAAANGVGKILVGQRGILSTPAASVLIRENRALGGIVLSASHNPGGPEGDFGIKYNVRNGGPAPTAVTEAVFERTKNITSYRILDHAPLDLNRRGVTELGRTRVEVIDAVAAYAAKMQELFDFPKLAVWFKSGKRLTFDAMHAVTGPYAREIFEKRLGADTGTVLNSEPLEDFGGGHPDPNLVYAHDLVEKMYGRNSADLGAASDGDGDRNMILGPSFFVSPGDSLAVIAEHLVNVAPGYHQGLKGVARSMPTSTAVDRVAAAQGIKCYETPTGWKYFGSLMDADLCTLCGEESFGTSSSHIREKDGIWAVLCWLSILAHENASVAEIMEKHWRRFGRSFFQRYDFEGLDLDSAVRMLDAFKSAMPQLPGHKIGGLKVQAADEFAYTDPVNQSRAEQQGIRLLLENQTRIVIRFSGTGTQGATLRLYFELFDREDFLRDADTVLKPFAGEVIQLLKLKEFCGVSEPTVVT